MPTDTCAKCLKPKGTQAGSITQWINICSCDGAPQPTDKNEMSRCKGCGKPVRAQRAGSLTQWIFQQDACNCDRPDMEMESTTATYKQPAFRGFADVDEAELEIESGKFPSQRYKPVEILGAGVSGTVYLSRDRLLGKRVAVKVLKTLDRETLLSFQNEARTTSKLTHPNIVKVLDFGSTDSGVPFMVMEYLPGSSLEAFIKEYDGLDADTTIRLFIQLSDALDYAHNAKILHRDLKPSNILVVDNNGSLEAHLIDFGVAKLQQQKTTIYNGTALVGTPAYMSPDQALGLEFDKRSDVYSLGCILFETLTGFKPFEAKSPLETISLHAHQPPPSILKALPENSQTIALEKIVETCLAKDPEQRYQTASALTDELKAVPSDMSAANRAVSDSLSKIGDSFAESNVIARDAPKTLHLTVLICCGVFAFSLFGASIYWSLMPAPPPVKLATGFEAPPNRPLDISSINATLEGTAMDRSLADKSYKTMESLEKSPVRSPIDIISLREADSVRKKPEPKTSELLEAIREYEKQIKHREEVGSSGPPDAVLANAYIGLYDCNFKLRRFSKLAELEKQILKYCPRGRIANEALVCIQTAANRFARSGKPMEALGCQEASMELLERTDFKDELKIASLELSIGSTYQSAGSHAKSKFWLERANSRLKKCAPQGMQHTIALIRLGVAYQMMKDYKTAFIRFREAEKYGSKLANTKDKSTYLGHLYYQWSKALIQTQKVEEAKSKIQQGLLVCDRKTKPALTKLLETARAGAQSHSDAAQKFTP